MSFVVQRGAPMPSSETVWASWPDKEHKEIDAEAEGCCCGDCFRSGVMLGAKLQRRLLE